VPDVSVYRWERISRDPSGRVRDDVLISPDIAVEITSPGQSANALFRRCRWYSANGVDISLLVDPDDESVLAFLSDGSIREWRGADRIDLDTIGPGFDLTVEAYFASLVE